MKVYKCLVTGDELFTEVVKREVVDGLIRIRAKYVTRSADSIDDKAIGGNPSAEEAVEGADDSNSVSGVNVVLDGRYQKMPGFGSKKEYQVTMKAYVKALQEILSEKDGFDLKEFQNQSTVAAKKLFSLYADAEFYTGESGNCEGLLIILNWETPEGETDEVPFLYYFALGVKEEKY